MQKHLFRYAWICAALALGILICLGLIAHMLLTRRPPAEIYGSAQLVRGAILYAAI